MEDEDMKLTTATDFSHLKEEPLKNQLEALFGSVEADQFLNPTIQDKRVKSIPTNISNKIGSIGAEELWESLRYQSQQKLVQSRPASHVHLLRRNNYDEENVERKVVAYRQRLQIMHNAAKFNDSKSKKLIHKVNLPKITGDWNVNPSIEGTNVCGTASSSSSAIKKDSPNAILPQIQFSSLQTCEQIKSGDSNAHKQLLIHENFFKNNGKVDVRIDDKLRNICFLSEKDATVPGQFRERMKDHGIVSSVGISNASHFYKKQEKRSSYSSASPSELRNTDSTTKRSPSSYSIQNGTVWHPLTMSAVIECIDNFSSNKKLTCVR